MDNPSNAVVCERLVKIYETATSRVQAVRGVDLRLAAGEAIAITGPSGSGKSSLLRMISGHSMPTAGRIEVNGIDLTSLRPWRRRRVATRLIAHVEQRPADNLLAHLTSLEQVERIASRRGADPIHARATLDALGLGHRLGHLPHELSGGEQQRLAFAKAGIGGTAIVVADEPTAELDERSASLVLDAIDRLTANGTTTLVATHDPRVIERMSTNVELRDGAIGSITSGLGTVAVIDASGRLQLPPDIRARFDHGTARLEWDEANGFLRVEKP